MRGTLIGFVSGIESQYAKQAKEHTQELIARLSSRKERAQVRVPQLWLAVLCDD